MQLHPNFGMQARELSAVSVCDRNLQHRAARRAARRVDTLLPLTDNRST